MVLAEMAADLRSRNSLLHISYLDISWCLETTPVTHVSPLPFHLSTFHGCLLLSLYV